MPPPRRKFQATIQETFRPPSQLGPHQTIARIDHAAGNNLWSIQLPSRLVSVNGSASSACLDTDFILVELPPRFRSQIWLRRGGFVLVELKAGEGSRDNKIRGEVVNVVGDEKIWRKSLKGKGWPAEFCEAKSKTWDNQDADLEELTISVGDMPPSDEASFD